MRTTQNIDQTWTFLFLFKFGLLVGLSPKLAPMLKTLSHIFRSENLIQTICGAHRGLFTLEAGKLGRKTNNSSKKTIRICQQCNFSFPAQLWRRCRRRETSYAPRVNQRDYFVLVRLAHTHTLAAFFSSFLQCNFCLTTRTPQRRRFFRLHKGRKNDLVSQEERLILEPLSSIFPPAAAAAVAQQQQLLKHNSLASHKKRLMSVEYFMERPQVVEKIPRATEARKGQFPTANGKKKDEGKTKRPLQQGQKGAKNSARPENGR